MRRIAFAVLAGFAALALLFTGVAWAPTISLEIRNQTSHDVEIVVFQPPPSSLRGHRLLSTLHHEVIPHRSFHDSGIEPESCVLVRVAHDREDSNAPCRNNPTPLDVRCDVPSHYACVVHRGEGQEVVVKIDQPGA